MYWRYKRYDRKTSAALGRQMHGSRCVFLRLRRRQPANKESGEMVREYLEKVVSCLRAARGKDSQNVSEFVNAVAKGRTNMEFRSRPPASLARSALQALS